PLMKDLEFKGGAVYFDAAVNDSRLVLENIINARKSGAVLLNYAEIVSFRFKGKKINQVEVRDNISKSYFFIQAKVIVNAAGPWADSVLNMQAKKHKPLLRPTKGVHFLLKRQVLNVKQAVVINSSQDKRLVFVIPWEKYILVGTTDTEFNGDLDHVFAQKRDIDYLLKQLNFYFPSAKITYDHIISAYAGVRPLVAQRKSNVSAISRQDAIIQSRTGMITVAGGKLTTYRSMAFKTVKIACMYLKKRYGAYFPAKDITKSSLKNEGISKDDLAKLSGLLESSEKADYLGTQYGTGLKHIIKIIEKDPVLKKTIAEDIPFILAQAVYCARYEMCICLTDFYRVNTCIYLWDPDHGRNTLSEVGLLFKEELNWSLDEFERQKKDYLDFIKENEGWRM
ncbi:MAG: FAD-dependent oxidoreductase, partial [bacterium]